MSSLQNSIEYKVSFAQGSQELKFFESEGAEMKKPFLEAESLYHILSSTSSHFIHALFLELHRGKQQAKDLYKAFIRKGSLSSPPASFANAPLLFQQMCERIDTRIDPIASCFVDDESGTRKFLLQSRDGFKTETVVIPMKNKHTVCVSSQIGCRMGCSFCQTATMGLVRNLEAKEIVQQVFVARHFVNALIQNVVFMGMGEPLDNFDEVMKAYEILHDPEGFAFGCKNITLSTAGKVDGIEKLVTYEGSLPNLAVSLHAANDALRTRLVPINRRWNLSCLKQTLLSFTKARAKKVLIAYVLLDSINDSLFHADELLRFVEGIPCKINVIPYNEVSQNSLFFTPSEIVQDRFVQHLRKEGHRVLLRKTKGDHIAAGCGQLGTQKASCI